MIPQDVLEKEFKELKKRFKGFGRHLWDYFISGFSENPCYRGMNIMVLQEFGLENLATEEGIEFLLRHAK